MTSDLRARAVVAHREGEATRLARRAAEDREVLEKHVIPRLRNRLGLNGHQEPFTAGDFKSTGHYCTWVVEHDGLRIRVHYRDPGPNFGIPGIDMDVRRDGAWRPFVDLASLGAVLREGRVERITRLVRRGLRVLADGFRAVWG